MRKHKEDKHSNIEKYECNSGDFRTNNKDSIPIHIKEEEKPVTVSLTCSKCVFEASEKSTLDTHEKQFNSIRCNICQFTTVEENALEMHTLSNHGETLSCDKCEYKCQTKDDVENHIRTQHTSPSVCDQTCKIEKK